MGKKILRFSEIVRLRSLWRVSAALHAGIRCRLGWGGEGGGEGIKFLQQ